jgi:catechol 2,3-dioxygenase-like lactoylglutathione lyase family enzyme
MKNDFPIQCYNIDHYTLIVPNAKAVADFHQNVLGYKLMNTIMVNAGSAPEGKHDMLNYVMSWPNSKKGVLVVTEGLTETSIFNQFFLKFGQGIHHVAFEVEEIDKVFSVLIKNGIELTSDKIMRDPLSGLRQFFISSKYTGVFIELIERKSETEDKTSEEQGFFTQDNMSDLAKTMKSYLDKDELKETEDDIKGLDSTTYFETDKTIQVENISNLNINVAEVDKAKRFLNEVLGFEFENDQMVNPNEAEKHLDFNAGNYGEGVIPVELALRVKDLKNSQGILDELKVKYVKQGNSLKLSASEAGYPLQLIHD